MDDQGDGVPRPHQAWPLERTRLYSVAELPESDWEPHYPEPHTILPQGRARRSSPGVGVGLLLLVLALVIGVAVAGNGVGFGAARKIAGSPVAAAGPVSANSPNVSPGSKTATSTPAPTSVLELEDNPLLADGISLPQITCKLPAMTRNPEQLRAYYQAALGCLDEAWQPVLEKVNEPFSSPRLEIEAGSSACGVAPSADEATAYYCSGGHVIFMPIDRLLDQAGLSQAAHLAVLAHEYGHHVQALSGILAAAYTKGEQFDKTSPEKLELTRRAELEANCFSGMFIAAVTGRGSISTKLGRAAADSFRDTVADDTHGTVKHQVNWGKAGFTNNRTAACNTWTAAPEEVS
jgi:predicted metalloprotease